MSGVVASITLRQLLGRRRILLLLLLGALLVLVAFIYRITGPSASEDDAFTAELLANFGVGTLLPLVTLIVGTAALGAEIDDGTAVYLLSKPISRFSIVLTKLLVAWLVGAALACAPMLIAGLIAAAGVGDGGLVIAFVVATAVGALAYTALFVALSLVTGRALVIGLAYVLIWEGFLAGLFEGTRTFSIRQHILALADALTDAPAGVLDATLEPAVALIVGSLIVAASIVVAVRRLSTFEIRGETA